MGKSFAGTRSPLREAELLAQVHDAINATDAHGILHTWNAGAERIYGYSAEEVLGKHVSILLFPEDVTSLVREVFEPLSTTDVLETTVRNRRKDGVEIFVALRLAVLRDREGNIEHIIGCSNEITERKRAEDSLKREIAEGDRMRAALRVSEERLKHLLLQSPAVLYSCRADGDFGATFVSENVASLFGHPARDYLQTSGFWLDHVHPEDRERVLSEAAREIPTGRTFVEYRFRHADGTYRFVRDSAVVVRDTEGNRVEMVGHMMDVTREKEAEEERREHDRLKYFSEALLSAQEAERKRVSRELHDGLNQRLAALILEMGVLERNPPDSPRLARRTCAALKAQVAEISDEVRRIALQLHSAGLEQFGLRAALKQECVSISDRSGIKIEFRSRGVPETVPENVSLCLYRVAQECLRNVVKHSQAKQATVTLIGARDYIRLRVADRGIGFRPEEARTRMTLGLISMNERLRQVDGTLKLDSEPGGGTRVEARVPLQPAHNA